jgi:hypothetical protein
VNDLAKDPARLAQMAESARAWGTPHAASRVARDLLVLAGLRASSESQSNGAASLDDPMALGGKGAV